MAKNAAKYARLERETNQYEILMDKISNLEKDNKEFKELRDKYEKSENENKTQLLNLEKRVNKLETTTYYPILIRQLRRKTKEEVIKMIKTKNIDAFDWSCDKEEQFKLSVKKIKDLLNSNKELLDSIDVVMKQYGIELDELFNSWTSELDILNKAAHPLLEKEFFEDLNVAIENYTPLFKYKEQHKNMREFMLNRK